MNKPDTMKLAASFSILLCLGACEDGPRTPARVIPDQGPVFFADMPSTDLARANNDDGALSMSDLARADMPTEQPGLDMPEPREDQAPEMSAADDGGDMFGEPSTCARVDNNLSDIKLGPYAVDEAGDRLPGEHIGPIDEEGVRHFEGRVSEREEFFDVNGILAAVGYTFETVRPDVDAARVYASFFVRKGIPVPVFTVGDVLRYESRAFEHHCYTGQPGQPDSGSSSRFASFTRLSSGAVLYASGKLALRRDGTIALPATFPASPEQMQWEPHPSCGDSPQDANAHVRILHTVGQSAGDIDALEAGVSITTFKGHSNAAYTSKLLGPADPADPRSCGEWYVVLGVR